jgi:hypothetical protein
MSDDSALSAIQALQYRDKPAAEAQLRAFIDETFPGLDPVAVELRPSAVSLNSFNGYMTVGDGRRLFFKTHVEPDSIIGEYYNAQLMADAGYPVIRPLYASTAYGKQFLIYDLISAPSVFDLMRQADQGLLPVEQHRQVAAAQDAADRALGAIYQATLHWQTASEAAEAPVHQLLFHRLNGKRFQDFYGATGGSPSLPADRLPLTQRWVINGRRYEMTLGDLVEDRVRLSPAQAGPAIVGHGDAHNGNVFFLEGQMVYFDPAFAGRHHPLLDLAKPLYHNVFAGWMYHPADYRHRLHRLQVAERLITVDMDEMPPSDRLRMFFQSKITHTLLPIAQAMQRRGWLRPDWRAYLKRALFCCPLLTMNLFDAARFPEEVRWIGLADAVIMGAESDGPTQSVLDQALDSVQASLSAAETDHPV